jgi:3-phenylpropionate/cinnamic acid dioxygenase small subunit
MTDIPAAIPTDVITSAALEGLIARSQINDVLVAYCQGVDRRDWDRVLACYHDDAVDSHGEFRGRPAELVEWMRKSHAYVSFCMHALSNVSISIAQDGSGLARVESYFISHKTLEAAEHDPYLRSTGATGPVRRTVGGRYVDTFENRRGVGWRILARTVVHEWMRREPQDVYVPLDPTIELSRRDRSDLLYSPLVTRRPDKR